MAKLKDAETLSLLVHSLSEFISNETLGEVFQNSLTIESFEKSISNEEWFTTLVYEVDEKIIAYISLVNNSHIYHLFVDKNFHRKGIATELWNCIFKESSSKKITVNASLSSVPFYTKLGFIKTEKEQQSMGIRYQPMSFKV